MPWLVRDDDTVVASLEIADRRAARRRGLLGRDRFDGALLLPGARWVHTIGMRFPIDVAHLAADGTILRCTAMRPGRIGRPCLGARQVLEAERGAFARWGLRPGDRVEVRP